MKHLIKCFRLATIFWLRNSSTCFVSRIHFLLTLRIQVPRVFSYVQFFTEVLSIYRCVIFFRLPFLTCIHWQGYGDSCTFTVAMLPFILSVELIFVKMQAIFVVRSGFGDYPSNGSGELCRYNAVRWTWSPAYLWSGLIVSTVYMRCTGGNFYFR